MSISLWDLRVISGYYEEVIPYVRELLSAGHSNSIPATCSFLCSAFHWLCQGVHGVVQSPTSEWICLWFRGRQISTPPPGHDNKKWVKALINTSYPSSLIALAQHEPRGRRILLWCSTFPMLWLMKPTLPPLFPIRCAPLCCQLKQCALFTQLCS